MTKSRLEIVDTPISEVKPYEGNPRRITEEAVDKVAASISSFGFQQPIVVDKDKVIIVGHTRHRAAERLKLKTVPVVVAEMPSEKIRAYRLADNRTADETSFDWDRLAEELEAIEELGLDLAETAFDESEIDGLIHGDTEVREVEGIETHDVEDRFWISVRGPLADQADALAQIQTLMAGMPLVEVEIGTSEES